MIRATAMAAAFVNAGDKAPDNHWVKRCVADRAKFTQVGVVKEDDIKVNVKNKTRLQIALQQRVIV